MIGLDTNVLVRYLLQDDPAQSRIANRIINALTEQDPGFIAIPVLCELTWVLRSSFGMTKSNCVAALSAILSAPVFEVEKFDLCQKALRAYTNGKADFADYLIRETALEAGCDHVVTFDKNALKENGFASA